MHFLKVAALLQNNLLQNLKGLNYIYYNIYLGYTFTANSFSISHLGSTVTTWWLDSDSVVTVDNFQQYVD